ncbi:MAG: hypothetical protein NT062_27900 [Proteobacteria bacterium]|nr:hypothetical protein [Pseudomonadota bacterium]
MMSRRCLPTATLAMCLLAACSTAHKATNDDAGNGDAPVTADGDPSIDAPVALIDAPVATIDAPPDSATLGLACNPLSQATCGANEKCTWVHDDATTGHSACAPAGPVAAGAACTFGAPGATGYDNCVAGSVCTGGVCEVICDNAGATPACGAGFGCVNISGLFGNAGGPLAAGVCEVSCDPLADNDYDGAGTASVRTGTACGADVNVGCYGNIVNAGAPTHFICALPATTTATRVHRQVLAANEQFLNSCHPGYALGFASDATGSTNVDCYAYCKPGNSYAGAATQEPNGKVGFACAVGSSGRQGNFGTAATAAVNGEHCMYSWNFELDAASVLHRSTTSDTLGICWDHTKYTYDHDGNPATAEVPLPRCASLPLASTTTLTAGDLACVDSASAGYTFAGRTIIHQAYRPPIVFPAFDARFAP